MTDSFSSLRRRDLLDALWQIVSAGRLTLLLLGLLSATLIVAAVFPQQPTGLDRSAAESWLAQVASSYGGVGNLLRAVGVFNVLEGFWFPALLALFAYNLALRLADGARLVRRLWRSPVLPPPSPRGRSAHAAVPSAGLDQVLAHVHAALAARYPVTAAESSTTQAQIYAVRGRSGAIGLLLAQFGALALVGGLLVNSAAGWRVTDIALAPNARLTLPTADGLEITLDAIAGTDTQPVSQVTVRWPNRSAATLQATPWRPGRAGNLWLVQRATGPALAVRARSGGRTLLLQSLVPGGQVGTELHTIFRPTQTEQAFAIPTDNLAFRVVSYAALPEQGISGPVFLVEAFRGDEPTPIFSQLVEENATLTLSGVIVDLQRDRHAVLELIYWPGLALLVAGLVSVLIGLALTLALPYTEAWVHMTSTDQTISATIHVAAWRRAAREIARLQRLIQEEATTVRRRAAAEASSSGSEDAGPLTREQAAAPYAHVEPIGDLRAGPQAKQT